MPCAASSLSRRYLSLMTSVWMLWNELVMSPGGDASSPRASTEFIVTPTRPARSRMSDSSWRFCSRTKNPGEQKGTRNGSPLSVRHIFNNRRENHHWVTLVPFAGQPNGGAWSPKSGVDYLPMPEWRQSMRSANSHHRLGSHRQNPFTLQFFAGQLACAANGLRLFAGALFRRLFIVAAKLHLAENSLPLHLFLERL